MNYSGVYFGRFQPLHIEHLARVKEIYENYPDISLNVGIADWRGEKTKSNFLAIEEGIIIAKLSLADLGLSDIGVLGVPLYPDVSLEDSIRSFVSANNVRVVFSGSDKTLKASREVSSDLGIEVVDLQDQEMGIRATDIRISIRDNTDLWKERLTPSAVKYVNGLLHDFRERLIVFPEGQKRPWVEGNSANANSERR